MTPSIDDISIRPLRSQDIYKAQELIARDADTIIEFAYLLAYCLQSGHEALVAASHDQRIVGIIAGKHGVDSSHIDVVCVAKDWRELGIATTLINQFRAHSNQNPIYLEVSATNIAAQRLYSHLGYVPTQVLSRFYPKSDGLKMRAVVA